MRIGGLVLTMLLMATLKSGAMMAQGSLPEITVTQVDEKLTKLWVNGYVNIIVLHCDDETVLLDSGFEETAEQVAEELRDMGVNRIKLLINTHADGDHAGGNSLLGAESTIVAHAN
jgi:glyoxylase-like metal-dependent hydrolase (beta-lactamase superfamily II)